MEKFVKGNVVVLPFPFSDLSGSKYRPALVLADLPGDDIILFQITSQQIKDALAVPLVQEDFLDGKLPVLSNIRLNRIFTASKKIIVRKAGTVQAVLHQRVIKIITNLLHQ